MCTSEIGATSNATNVTASSESTSSADWISLFSDGRHWNSDFLSKEHTRVLSIIAATVSLGLVSCCCILFARKKRPYSKAAVRSFSGLRNRSAGYTAVRAAVADCVDDDMNDQVSAPYDSSRRSAVLSPSMGRVSLDNARQLEIHRF